MEIVKIDNATLYHGDSLEVLPLLTNGEVDAIISDPPYATESFGGKCTACDWDVPFSLTDFWEFLRCKSKPAANVVLFCNLKFAYDLIASNRRGYRYDLVWSKSNRVGFFNANLMPMRAHENILVFGRPNHQKMATYNPLKTDGGRPRVNRVKSRKDGGVYGASQKPYTTTTDGNLFPHSVLEFAHDRGSSQYDNFHPTQKPVALLEWLIATFTNPGDTVLDCFMGSGSTGIAARNLGRRFIGIEREEKFFNLVVERFKSTTASTIPPTPESEQREDTEPTEDLSCQE
jgi:site-specific DNA-methyltransferase (adenine-specific)